MENETKEATATTATATKATTATKAKGTAKVVKATAKATAKAKEEVKGKGVAVWQNGLRPLRDTVNLAQLNAETVKNKVIADTLSRIAKEQRGKLEKSLVIPARLNRRYVKFCLGK